MQQHAHLPHTGVSNADSTTDDFGDAMAVRTTGLFASHAGSNSGTPGGSSSANTESAGGSGDGMSRAPAQASVDSHGGGGSASDDSDDTDSVDSETLPPLTQEAHAAGDIGSAVPALDTGATGFPQAAGGGPRLDGDAAEANVLAASEVGSEPPGTFQVGGGDALHAHAPPRFRAYSGLGERHNSQV